MKKLIMFLMAISMLTLVLAGCSDGEAAEGTDNSGDGDKESVVVVLKTLSSPYWKFVEAGAKQAFKDLDVNGKVVGPSAESEVIAQINMMEDALTNKPGAIVTAPTQPPTAIPVFEKYKEANIPVLLLDTDADWSDKTTFIGTDNITAGNLGGEFLASLLSPGDKVAIIGGALGNTASDERMKGAQEALEKAGFEIVANQPADSDRSKAASVMENIIQNHPDIKGVFAVNDDMALGASRAIESRGLEVAVVGTDGTIEAVEAVIAGKLAGTIAQNPYEMGYQGVVNALKAIKGEEVDPRIESGADRITKENAEEKLAFLKSLLE
ncbi:sugar ABC transporter substrate-binding protein [Sporosarcina sp. CAU 1771]